MQLATWKFVRFPLTWVQAQSIASCTPQPRIAGRTYSEEMCNSPDYERRRISNHSWSFVTFQRRRCSQKQPIQSSRRGLWLARESAETELAPARPELLRRRIEVSKPDGNTAGTPQKGRTSGPFPSLFSASLSCNCTIAYFTLQQHSRQAKGARGRNTIVKPFLHTTV
jgi:hypothetical protein